MRGGTVLLVYSLMGDIATLYAGMHVYTRDLGMPGHTAKAYTMIHVLQ